MQEHPMTAQKPRVLRVTVHTSVLRAALGFSGMTQRELAHKAGISQPMIAHLASGRRTQCRADTAAKLCKALDLKAVKMEPKDLFDVKVFRAESTPAMS
jgi:DNA-binding Xre family transcriptional regulator